MVKVCRQTFLVALVRSAPTWVDGTNGSIQKTLRNSRHRGSACFKHHKDCKELNPGLLGGKGSSQSSQQWAPQ